VIDSGDDDSADFGPITADNLYKRHVRGLTKYVARRVHNPQATVEIVGKIWEAILVRFEKEPPPEDWDKLIWGIARNKVADWGRSRKTKPDPIYLDWVDLERAAGGVVDEPRLERIEEERPLLEALWCAMNNDLTELQREAVILRYVDKLTYPEMANVLGTSKSAVKKHVERGIRKARISMAKAGFSVRATQEVK